MAQDDCIFCKIVLGLIPIAKIYEDDDIIAFLDISPIKPGHAVVIPKAHHENMLEMPASLAKPVHQALQTVGRALMAATGATGLNTLQNTHPVAGQSVFHVHWHLIPRHAGDGLEIWPQGSYASQEEMRDLANKIAGLAQA